MMRFQRPGRSIRLDCEVACFAWRVTGTASCLGNYFGTLKVNASSYAAFIRWKEY